MKFIGYMWAVSGAVLWLVLHNPGGLGLLVMGIIFMLTDDDDDDD